MTESESPRGGAERQASDADEDRTRLISPEEALKRPREGSARPGPLPDQQPAAEAEQHSSAPTEIAPSAADAAPAAPSHATPAQATPAPAAPTGGAQTELAAGTVINNNYRIQTALKSGGMGEVYRGVEVGTEDPVAIKAIRPDLIRDAQASDMFRREARTLRLLHDDAIVRYYNYVHDRDLDRYFLVMEFIDGIPLSDHIRQYGALPVDAGRTLLTRLAKGLAKAHAKGVVHRDLSPDNVMLASGIISEARLIDFGIAKSQTIAEGTIAGQFAGKFKYVAPEQLGHFGGEMGPAVDIYGLALLMAAALRGKPLDMGGSIVEAVEARRSIPDLSQVPAEFRPLLSHMLEPDPKQRPGTMRDVLHLLDNPAALPVHYYQDGFAPHEVTQGNRGSASPLSLPPQPSLANLQVPNTARPAHIPSFPPAQASAPPPQPVRETRGSGGLLWGLLACLALAGGGGWYGWQAGWIPGGAGADLAAQTGPDASPPEGELPAINTDTREGYLAMFDTGPCSLSTRLSAGRNAGRIETYAASDGGFEGLPVAYEERFGARPSLLHRVVSPDQCAAVDFARSLQGRWPDPVSMSLSADQAASGDALQARLRSQPGQSLWTVLITPTGGVYNLTQRLKGGSNGAYTLDFGLTLSSGAEAAPQLVLAVASDTPLARAAILRDGAQAAKVLPDILQEIRDKSTAASAALAYVLLSPAETGQDGDEAEN